MELQQFCGAIVVFAVFVTVSGWTAIEKTDNTKVHDGYCYSDKQGVGPMEKGEIKTITEECVKVRCSEGGLISYSGCSTKVPPNGCTLTAFDFSRSYPDCCPQIEKPCLENSVSSSF